MSTIKVEMAPGRRIDSHLEDKANALANSVSGIPKVATKISEPIGPYQLMSDI